MVLSNTKMKKVKITKYVDILTSNENYILGIGEVFQSVVESFNGSTISFNGYHSQCV